MGLFDSASQQSVTKARTEALSMAEGVAAIAYLMVISDGYMADQEVKLLVSTLEGLQCFQSYSSDVTSRMFNKIQALYKRLDLQDYLELAVSAIPDYMGQTVFAVAADLAFVDGSIEDGEKAVLEMIYKIFGVSEETALEIIRVMQIRHQY